MPELITTGAQEALPYMVSDMFSFKAKKNGKITAITPDYMLIEYADKLILEIYKKNTNDNYILYFLVYLYNYERWFSVKRGRNRTPKISGNETI